MLMGTNSPNSTFSFFHLDLRLKILTQAWICRHIRQLPDMLFCVAGAEEDIELRSGAEREDLRSQRPAAH